MRRMVVAVFGMALAGTPALARDDQPQTTVSTGQAQAAIEAKQPARAIELVRPILARFEHDYAGEKRQIYCAISQRQSVAYLADAAKQNRPVVAVGADWCKAQYVNAFALIDLDRFGEAQVAFERLVGFAPRNSRYLNELGYVLVKQKKWAEALAVYRRAELAADLAADRVTAERCIALKGAGYSLVEIGDLRGAAAAYTRCLAIDPADQDSPRELDYIREQWRLTA